MCFAGMASLSLAATALFLHYRKQMPLSLIALRRYLRLTPFSTSTEQGRSDERYRLALLSVVANVFSKGIAMVVMLLSVSWTLPYLGEERFGAWMTIASFVGMLIFLDLGIGNALTNRVANVAIQSEQAALVQTISGGLGLLFIIGVVAVILLCILTAMLPWGSIIRVKNPLILVEVREALFWFSIFFGINLFSSGIQRVFAGLQRSFEAHAASAIGSFFSLITLWWVAKNQGDIAFLLIATLGCQSATGFLLLVVLKIRGLFRFQGIALAIRAERNTLLKVGGLFLVLQIGAMVGWGADSLIISSTLGAVQVAVYSVTQRLFQFVGNPLAMINAPLWSAYADAHARGDRAFIRRTLKKSMIITAGVTVIGGGLLCVMSQELIARWTKGSISVPMTLVFVFFIWTFCEALGNSFAMMMNGCGVVREQVIAVLLLTTIALPTKLVFVNFFGVTGMLASYIVLYCAIVLILYGFIFRSNLIEKIGRQ